MDFLLIGLQIKNQFFLQKKNEINCDCIKEKLNEKQLEAVYDFFEIDDFCNIDLQNLEFEISRYLSKNASIIDLL